MSELRIGAANSEPAAGTLKVGSGDVQEIYLGSQLIWPSVLPADDPYSPSTGTPRYLYNNYVTNSNQQLVLTDLSFTPVQPVDGNGSNITFGSLPNFGTLTRVAASDKHEYIAVLGSGSTNSTLYLSSDYGQTFVPKPTFPGSNLVKISKSGRTIIYINFGGSQIYHSNDFGNTFNSLINSFPTIPPNFNVATNDDSIKMSADGKYILINFSYNNGSVQYGLYLSSDYGSSFTDITSVNNLGFNASFGATGVSGNGRYIYIISDTTSLAPQRVTVSSNNGNSWVNTDESSIPENTRISTINWSGKYISFSTQVPGLTKNVYYYNNFLSATSPNIFTASNSSSIQRSLVDNTGQYYIGGELNNYNSTPVKAATSNDFFVSFSNNLDIPGRCLELNIVNT